MKKDYTLYDLWMRELPQIKPYEGEVPAFLSHAREAKRFVFDDAASEFMGELLRKAPLEILQQHHFAKPPYDTTWIEINHDAYFRLGLQLPNDPSLGPPDERYGVYINHGTAAIVSSSLGGKSVGMSPIYFELDKPVSFDQELDTAELFGLNRTDFRAALLGRINVQGDWWDSKEAADICRSHSLYIIQEIVEGLPKEALRGLLQSGAGNLKLILTMLLLLTRPHATFNVHEVGHRRSFIKGKQVVLKEHHVLKLRLEHKDPVTRYLSHLSTGLHRKLHDVRGHWAQNRKKTISCSHDWVQFDPHHFQCVKCGTNRWWKTDHQRGKKKLGQVTKEYNVTK